MSVSGWVLLDKPSGMTSRRAGGIVMRMFGATSFGHLGTLDPMASGLLPVALGEATKMIPYIEMTGANNIGSDEKGAGVTPLAHIPPIGAHDSVAVGAWIVGTPPASGVRQAPVSSECSANKTGTCLTPLAGGVPTKWARGVTPAYAPTATKWARGVNRCTPQAQSFAKNLKRKMTMHECLLWKQLKKSPNGFAFRKQQPIGKYIVDFINFEKKLIIELDGNQHGEEKQIIHDYERDKWLQNSGYRIIRFWNNEVFKKMPMVLDTIYHYLINENDIPRLQDFYKQIVGYNNPACDQGNAGRRTGREDMTPLGAKEYLFSVQWGFETDTLDITGKITAKNDKTPDMRDVDEFVREYTGRIEQIPPAYSAIHVNGQRAYELARAGHLPDMKPRPVTIYALARIRDSSASTMFRVLCSAGTYVRSIGRDIARGCGDFMATVDMIRRTATNGFLIKDAVPLDFLENLYNNDPDSVLEYLKPTDFGLDDIPVWNLDETDAKLFQSGGFIASAKEPADDCLWKVYHGNKFLGIGHTDKSNVLKPKRVII